MIQENLSFISKAEKRTSNTPSDNDVVYKNAVIKYDVRAKVWRFPGGGFTNKMSRAIVAAKHINSLTEGQVERGI